jgi:hypothetical protein
MDKPPVFVGSSTEGKRIAKATYRLLTYWAEPKLCSHGVFLPGRFPVDELERAVRACRFAVFVATPDDEVTKRGDTALVMRDNVLFEFGLFGGILGRHRVFLLTPDRPRIDVPTDLSGLTLAEYDFARSRRDDESEVISAVQVGVDSIETTIRQDWGRTLAEEENRKRQMQASERGQAISRLFGVATKLYDALWKVQRESIQALIFEQTFESLRVTAVDTVKTTAAVYRDDAAVADACQEFDCLTQAIVMAIGAVPNPRELVPSTEVVEVAKAIALDAAWAYLRGADLGQAVASSANQRGKPQYEVLTLAYANWWHVYGPPLEKATKAMNDALARASIQLGLDATRQYDMGRTLGSC